MIVATADFLLEIGASPERWIELLTLYGPMALFVFMVVVLLKVAQSSSGITPGERRVRLIAYSAVWLSIFILATVVVIVYWKTNFPSEYVVSGTITNLAMPQAFSTEEDIFLHRRRKAGSDFEYDWRLIKPRKFVGNVELLLQQKPFDREALRYKLPITEEFYGAPVELEYHEDHKLVIKLAGGKRESIIPTNCFIVEPFAIDAFRSVVSDTRQSPTRRTRRSFANFQ